MDTHAVPLLLADAGHPFISWDTWGLVAVGVLVTALWLFFRRMFPSD